MHCVRLREAVSGGRCDSVHGGEGDGFDDAMCESFFATLECELLDRNGFHIRIEAKMAFLGFIEDWYIVAQHHCRLD